MIDYRILPEQSLIVICVWGIVTLDDIITLSRHLRSDPHFFQQYDTIVENTQLETPPKRDDIRKLSEARIDLSKPAGKVAVISPEDIIYGMSRMHEMISEVEGTHNIQVFRGVASALKWLDKEGIDVEPIFKEIKGE